MVVLVGVTFGVIAANALGLLIGKGFGHETDDLGGGIFGMLSFSEQSPT